MKNQQPKPLTKETITSAIHAVNDLLYTLYGNHDTYVLTGTGAVYGQRRIPSLMDELEFEKSVIGYVATGFQNHQIAEGYFEQETFIRRAPHLIMVIPKSKKDFIASIEDADAEVEAFEPIFIMALGGQTIADAFIVALDKLGYVADIRLIPNQASETARKNNGYAERSPETINTVRISERGFLDKWVPFYGVQRASLNLPMPSSISRQSQPIETAINSGIKQNEKFNDLKPTDDE